jgi:hypothetical protein
MMMDKRRTWLKAFIALFVLTAGLPYLMILLGLILMPFGLSGMLFVPALYIHNAYFMLPELIFGNTIYPSEEYGYLPGFAGYALATLLYGVIAFAMFLWQQASAS